MSKRLEGIEILSIISAKNFRDEEYIEPRKILESEGALVKVASNSLDKAIGMLGLTVSPDLSFLDVKPDEYHAVILAGGSGAPQYLWGNTVLHYILKETHRLSRVIGAICLAPAVLAEAGLLNNLKATVFPSPDAIAKLRAGGAHYVDEPVVVEGNIITARDPKAASLFGKEVAQAIWRETLKKPVAEW